jgi:hypothetical protein
MGQGDPDCEYQARLTRQSPAAYSINCVGRIAAVQPCEPACCSAEFQGSLPPRLRPVGVDAVEKVRFDWNGRFGAT